MDHLAVLYNEISDQLNVSKLMHIADSRSGFAVTNGSVSSLRSARDVDRLSAFDGILLVLAYVVSPYNR